MIYVYNYFLSRACKLCLIKASYREIQTRPNREQKIRILHNKVGTSCSNSSRLAKEEPLFVVETDKSAVEVPAPADGVLSQIIVQVGQTAPVRAPIAVIAQPGEPERQP